MGTRRSKEDIMKQTIHYGRQTAWTKYEIFILDGFKSCQDHSATDMIHFNQERCTATRNTSMIVYIGVKVMTFLV